MQLIKRLLDRFNTNNQGCHNRNLTRIERKGEDHNGIARSYLKIVCVFYMSLMNFLYEEM